MSQLLRALLISAAATGVAAAVLSRVVPRPAPRPPRPNSDLVEADDLSAAQMVLLLKELEASL